jgi:pSer/pThr/pTyr-binding forkhead associated (FHA) protein
MPDDTVVVTFMNGPADGRSVIVHNPRVSIGRGSDHDVAIDFDPRVVSNHLEIIHDGNQWQLTEHDGASDVQLNGTRFYGRVTLTTNSLVRLGDTLLKISISNAG